MAVLSSQWQGLSPHLVARIFPVDYKGNKMGSIEVQAPFTDATMEASFNWQSSFENAGAESKAPALTAMLQSGAIQPLMNALGNTGIGQQTMMLSSGETKHLLSEFEGRTGITKLNSTQVFSGMQPIKITATLLFRAYADAKKEVNAPFDQLMQWALPQQLAKDGVLAEIVNRVSQGEKSFTEYLKTLMPSFAPHLVGLKYKLRSFPLMVIESISEPLDSPITRTGHYASLAVPVTFSTLTALDRHDWATITTKSTTL